MAGYDKPFSMRGKVRKDRQNYYIDLWWQGKRNRIFSDKDGVSFGDSKKHTERMLAHINYENDYVLSSENVMVVELRQA